MLTLKKDEARIAYLKNTGTLRFTMYATTHDNTVHTYSHDFSKDDQILNHNNVLIELGTVPTVPDGDPDHGGGGDDSEEPEEPDDPDDPDDGDDSNVPDVPVNGPVLKVDVSLIEKDYIIEVPSHFEESDKPDNGGDDNNGGGSDDNNGGDEVKKGPVISGTIDGKAFDVKKSQDVKNAKSVVIYMDMPTGLAALSADIKIGSDPAFSLDLLNYKGHALESVLNSIGLPKKNDKGKLKFDISAFLNMLGASNSFTVVVKDNNGEGTDATIKLTK